MIRSINKLLLFCLASFLLANTSNIVLGQESASYEMTLAKVINNVKENSIDVLLKVSPKIEDFKLILSGRVEYNFSKTSIQVNIQKDPNIQIIIYGDDFSNKAPEIYDLIKEEFEIKEQEYLIVFRFSNLKSKEIIEGHIKYGLWETRNTEIRHEQMFFFNKNDIIIN